MLRRLLLLPVLLLTAAPVLAQDVPESVRKDLWCGIAFTLASRDVPEDAAPEVLAEVLPYERAAQSLMEKTKSDHLEAGYTEEAYTTYELEQEAEVSRALASTDPALAPPYTFEDCAELIGL